MPSSFIPMAVVYDFDGTLAPGNVQENQFIPDVGMTKEEFWSEVNQATRQHQADGILMYMRLMLRKANAAQKPIRRQDFEALAAGIQLYQGVGDWFDRINRYGRERGVRLQHYIVSSGNAEIIEKTSIAAKFECIYASRFFYDENDVADWPALAINYTTKTQFLFRINKGAHDLSDSSQINEYVAMAERPVPFGNMVYVGDGETDVPCFRLVKEQGGLSIAVYKPRTKGAKDAAMQFVTDGRVQSIAPADYRDSKTLDIIVKARIDLLAAQAKERNSLVSS